MSDDDWQLVNVLFSEASAMAPHARAAFLDSRCVGTPLVRAEVESLLWFSSAGLDVDGRVAEAVAEVASGLRSTLPVETIGPYRLLSAIGSGGMGSVYLAERTGDGFTQRVAIKLMHGVVGPEGIRRFRAERRMLASLEHVNVARLIDGGTTPEGLPFLVLEYVDGEPIDRYCNARALPLRDRLALFCQVCDAVAFAHRRLVVHRDLKPSNILIAPDGMPKLLDFGIAKLLEDDGTDALLLTTPSMRVMTPAYASPEQIRGAPITMATDVYSLGVLLFELLTGTRPHRFTSRDAGHMALVVATGEAPAPSTVADPSRVRELRGDLDTIVLTALNKDPARRYPTVEQLADDLRRYRDGRPIHARPSTWGYRASRFLGRHRWAAVAAVLVVALTAGFGVALAASARRVAQERDTAERVTALLADMFAATDPAQTRGDNLTARELLDRGAARVDETLREQPEVRAPLLDALGNVYFGLGLWEPAQTLLTNSITARQEVGDRDSLRAAATMHRLADVLLWRGQAKAAADLIASSLEIRRRRLGPRHADVAASVGLQARASLALGSPWSAIEPLYLEAIDIWRDTQSAGHQDEAVALVQIARGRSAEGNFAGAESAARESLEIRRRAFGDGHPLTTESLVTVAQVVHQSGRAAESEPLSREVLERRLALYQNDAHPWVHQAINQLAMVLADQGKLQEAEPLARQASDRSRATVGIFTGTSSNLRVLGIILEDQGRLRAAEAAYLECVAIARKASNGAVQIALGQLSLARLYVLTGRAAAAVPIAEEAVALLQQRYGARHFQAAPALLARAVVLAANGRHQEAEALFRDTVAIQRAALPAHHPALIASVTALGGFLVETDRAAEAEPILAEAYRAYQTALPRGHWSFPWTQVAYGVALRQTGHSEGAALVEDGLRTMAAMFPAGDPHLRDARRLARGTTGGTDR